MYHKQNLEEQKVTVTFFWWNLVWNWRCSWNRRMRSLSILLEYLRSYKTLFTQLKAKIWCDDEDKYSHLCKSFRQCEILNALNVARMTLTFREKMVWNSKEWLPTFIQTHHFKFFLLLETPRDWKVRANSIMAQSIRNFE